MKTKFIFITGGVLSSLGKGLAAASIGALLEARGLQITIQKLDPYINVDPGTMNPFQHGEVFVTDDGAETDLDLGHYERYTHAKLGQRHNYTSGRIYYSVITKERRGDYLGGTVQVIPHITDEIKKAILQLNSDADIAIIEIGGTVGDIEGLPFLEAIRQLRSDLGTENTLYIHLTYVPYIQAAGELKTKPTQHSVKELLSIGIQPDILLCRTQLDLSPDIKSKISLFCNVEEDRVIAAKDVKCIYEVPLRFHEQELDERIIESLNMWTRAPVLTEWENLIAKIKEPKHKVRIAMVGKYVNLKESYKSLNEALFHGGVANRSEIEIDFVNSEEAKGEELTNRLSEVDGILVPGGFGPRGIPGKLEAITYARENKVPFFGICLGMQLAVIEFARNVAGLPMADSTEFASTTPDPVIYLMKEWYDYRTNKIQKRDKSTDKGGTMRLGAYPCQLVRDSKAYAAYGVEQISERHRHRYEFNNSYRKALEDAGIRFAGLSPNGELVEIMEIPQHPWFLACQFHPEFKSRPLDPHPLFVAFMHAALAKKAQSMKQ
ncbi:MAG: CTP synthase [Deltaproteobacteria bacterium]|nr:CTP synthase [Deltaproteobacteria bacterium]MBW1719031.1 CTP synthase [Deltaproteobacteria bacterium]MBW1963930.1 CTP synthase [Deltaproteobacteria bacterium]MBW2081170.1 CTP synthase [Deltaproteobacteria bacterium]MBW2349967.1 CTP synthase [Deltaproteobacteria bacterium]